MLIHYECRSYQSQAAESGREREREIDRLTENKKKEQQNLEVQGLRLRKCSWKSKLK